LRSLTHAAHRHQAAQDARDAVTPDLKEAKKKEAAVMYNGDDKNRFLKKLTLRFKDPKNTTLIMLASENLRSLLMCLVVLCRYF
jgi:hypothetical protein